MNFPRTNMSPIRQEIIYLTGGLNESVASVQLKGGELRDCINYQEVDGAYSGYYAIAGYERFDGQTAPSDVAITIYQDKGIDSKTYLLLEAETGGSFIDLSGYATTITNVGVVCDDNYFSLSSASFLFTQTASLIVPNYNFNQDFCLEFRLRMEDITGTSVLFEESGVIRISIVDGAVVTDLSTDGITYDNQLVSTALVTTNQFVHVSIQVLGSTVFCSIGGIVDSSTITLSSTVYEGTTDFQVGSSSFSGYIESIRLSLGSIRYPLSFIPPTRLFSTSGYYQEYYNDIAREAQRVLITTIPGEGMPLGIIEYEGDVYVFRNAIGGATAEMYKATPSGWTQIVQPVGDEFNPGGSFEFHIYRFESFNSNQPVLAIVDGVSTPRLFDGSTITIQTSPELPDNAVSPKFASKVGAYDNRLFYGYSEGSVVFSAVGDPITFSAITTSAGELFLGDPLTNIIEAPGNVLILFLENFIKVVKSVAYDGTNPWVFAVETFSRSAGAIERSAQSLLGDVYFADSEGISSLTTVSSFGDFSASTISKKVQKTYLAKKELISGSLIDRRNNQYKLFFSDGTALYFSFNIDKKVKGVTKIIYPIPISHITQSSNGVQKYFTSSSGYAYRMDSGTSFDGAPIITYLLTAFYHYKTPGVWKHFKKITGEFSMEGGLAITVRALFDFQEEGFPKTVSEEYLSKGVAGLWDYDRWGEFSWGISDIQKGSMYLRGYGTNMAIDLRTSSKYKRPHVINNLIVEYALGKRQS